jgi:uncharacterized metal-binding protein
MNKIVFSCSGCSDLGHISDLSARRLRDNGVRNMHCLAAVGAYPNESAKDYTGTDILVLDGCPVSCGKIVLKKAGIDTFKSVLLTDLGYQKGKTPVTQDILDEIYFKIETL